MNHPDSHEVKRQLDEALQALAAIRGQDAEAIVASGATGDQTFTLTSADEPYRVLVETMNEGAATLTQSGQVLYANRRLTELLGVPLRRLLGADLSQFLPAGQERALAALLIQFASGPTQAELTLSNASGTLVPVLVSNGVNPAAPDTHNVIFADLTERKKAEQDQRQLELQLFQSQKLESLGILAGGIAHDFNNILTAILGHAELAQAKTDAGSPARIHLGHIREAGTRAAELTRQLLAYTGKAKFQMEAVDVNRLLVEMRHLLEVSISKAARIELSLEEGLPSVLGDASQLHQVVMNLTINASEAIGEVPGVICLSTSRVTHSEAAGTGDWVQIGVSDNGCGMSPQTVARIFDPFFTTKFTGRGLGMAAVHGILRAHGGQISVTSEVGRGTTFTVLLPATTQAPVAAAATTQAPVRPSGSLVLLVDDEDSVRAAGQALLQELGYRTVSASDGEGALAVLTRTPGVYAVVLDLTMPGMGGEATYREIKRLYPSLRVVISSGYPETEVAKRLESALSEGFLPKPYDLDQLRQALHPL